MQRKFKTLRTLQPVGGGEIEILVVDDPDPRAEFLGYWMNLKGTKVGATVMIPLLKEMDERGAIVVASHNTGTSVVIRDSMTMRHSLPDKVKHIVIVSNDKHVALLANVLGIVVTLSGFVPAKTAVANVQRFSEAEVGKGETLFFDYVEFYLKK